MVRGMKLLHVAAFVTEDPFSGNPAAVCFLEEERDDAWMQGVAREMNLSETAFLRRRADDFDLRWFTPAVEVDLCGHATLASAHALWTDAPELGALTFHTRSGALQAIRHADGVELDFPATPTPAIDAPPGLHEALGASGETHQSRFDYLVRLPSQADVERVAPNFGALRDLKVRGVLVTAPGAEVDFVSRFFAPGAGIDEDPVTGSAHCALATYWAERLEQPRMSARQLSARGGALEVELVGERVKLRGAARTTLRGELLL